jgi:hypothetical protein
MAILLPKVNVTYVFWPVSDGDMQGIKTTFLLFRRILLRISTARKSLSWNSITVAKSPLHSKWLGRDFERKR